MDDASSQINDQINALLRPKPPDEIQAILDDTARINNLQLVDGDGNNIGTVLPEVRKRLLAWTPFVHNCQNLAGPREFTLVYEPSLRRESFDHYVKYTFDASNPTTYDATLALTNHNQRPPHHPIPFQDPNIAAPTAASTTTAAAATTTAAATAALPSRPVISTAEKKKNEFDRIKRNMDAYEFWNTSRSLKVT